MPTYFPKRIEPKWQRFWLENKTFRAVDGDPRPKYYILDMFPYPSGDGLHVGHPEGYTATDILARYKRMRGCNVLHPMGWDAFGLPAEQYAVKTGTHPRETTAKNIDNFRRQIQMLGFSYDWDREISTTDPGYYKWTQWIFLKLYDTWFDAAANKGRPIADLPIPPEVQSKGDAAIADYRDAHRLAYVAEAPVNWCPELGTVLANEEVVNGKSEVGGHPVVRTPLRQWMLRITSYAERLLADLDGVDWPEPIKKMQRDWIGRSEGAEVDFLVLHSDQPSRDVEEWFEGRAKAGVPAKTEEHCIRVFTTRPDTLFGATYMVLAPEYPLVAKITTDEQRPAVEEYRRRAAAKSDMDRTELAKEKTGVFTGAFAVNPVTSEPIPVWIADYVLMGYGTGAIMAVPAHDERDFAFATKFNLDVVEVVANPAETPLILKKIHEWLGEWERRVDRDDGDDRYLKVALLLNCGFDIESFESDKAAYVHDPLWDEVRWYYDPGEGKGLAVAYLENDFADLLLEYVDQEEDTQILVFSLDPSDEDEMEVLDEDEFEPIEDHADHECGDDCEIHGEFKAFTGEGFSVDSGIITGLPTAEAKTLISSWLSQKGLGRKTINYKLRDWLFSRQRYWGEPFPIIWNEAGRHERLADADLPLQLPELSDFKPTGTPDAPLSKAGDWLKVVRNGQTFRRETNTMPQWAGSCWYYLRFIDPTNDQALCDPAKEKYWMPVDLYVGGAEHAVLHLLYSRFWHKVLFDAGVVSTPEPFGKLVNQGMILGETMYRSFQKCDKEGRTRGPYLSSELAPRVAKDMQAEGIITEDGNNYYRMEYISEDNVEKIADHFVLKGHPGIRIDAYAFKMSKSRGNVVNPDDVVNEFGADALRLYEMFMGPLEATKPWNMKGVEGIWRFLNRVWRLIVDEHAEENKPSPAVSDNEPSPEELRLLHQTIRGVTDDLDAMRFNTAISKLMELVNALTPLSARPRRMVETLVLLLAPLAPHLAEELWQTLGHPTTLAYEPWPTFDPTLCEATTIEVAIQINNKVRSKLVVAPDLGDDSLIDLARKDEKICELTSGKEIVKSFVVTSRKGKLVNLVVKG